MSTALIVHIYGLNAPPAAALDAMVRALVSAGAERWKEASVRGPALHQHRLDRALNDRAETAIALIASTPLGEFDELCVRAALPCWRPGDSGMEQRWVPVTASAFGDGFAKRNYADLRLSGSAQITLTPAHPYVADTAGTRGSRDEKVETNLAGLLDLLNDLAVRLSPTSIKVFVDAGLYLPLNAHAAYYRDALAVLDDVRFLQEVWQRGLPRHHVLPLRDYAAGPKRSVLHEWRSDEAHAALWERLRGCIIHEPTITDVEWALTSRRFDTVMRDGSSFVLAPPHYLNGFLDRFFLEILEHADGGRDQQTPQR